MELGRTSSKSARTMHQMNKARDWEDIYTRFMAPLQKDNLDLVKSKESDIKVETDDSGEIIVTVNKYKNLISLKQRDQNECGYYSLISVFFPLQKFGIIL